MKIILLSIFVMISFVAKSQELTVFYKEERRAHYSQLRSSVHKRFTSEEDLALIKDKAKVQGNQFAWFEFTSVLRIDKNKSIYYPQEEISNDTVNSAVSYGKEGEKLFISREISEREHSIVYINIQSKKKISTEYTYGNNYLISEDLTELDWEITKERKKIGKYECQKAILKHYYDESQIYASGGYLYYTTEVWFTDDIPYGFGPAGHWGLPGLILEFKKGKTRITLDKIIFDLDGFKIKPPVKGEKITREALELVPIMEFREH
ncbi:GLPGLI family protein [Aquimarina sp. MMG016]|uniref:GLPGLI family protein n=1 Tax=Aquimarina sp. MMG016 TaxID=2822690 RepID=UPI001B3A297B|nr:GLPGLI family protein [Aquimarina sp. MMG016]MBQ4822386.1 GLPGLI family protein [Aquimarina sp. MMG016]